MLSTFVESTPGSASCGDLVKGSSLSAPSSASPVVVDFETEAIDQRPNYPPLPVGVSIKFPGRKARYYAFGHPTNNNATVREALAALQEAWAWPGGLLFHNAKFDLDVAQVHFGLPLPNYTRIFDTMIEVFLDDPHAKSHGLKPSAERLLGMPPEERDAVKDWLVDAGYVTRASKQWGAFISEAPGDLVGAYADGDVVRTEKLHTKLMPTMKKRKMLDAIERERKLIPILIDMEQQGVPVDYERLAADCARYTIEFSQMTDWIRKRLSYAKLNVDSADDLVEALLAKGKVDEAKLGKTPKGAWKTDKESLANAITDATLASMLAHRASLATCLTTFMLNWLNMARGTGRIYTTWNQLKQYGPHAAVGAVTGRMSSSPNFQNIPKEFPRFWKHQAEAALKLAIEKGEKQKVIDELKAEVKKKPKMPFELSPLPLVRSYIAPPKGWALIGRDYSQQELRILAHFEDGAMLDAYRQDPWLDIHDHVRNEIRETLGREFDRSVVKQINFGLIYGMGAALMAKKAGCSVEDAKQAKQAVLATYPGLRDLQNGLKDLAVNNQPLRTWGGRLYHCEPPKMIDGEMRTFEYKMLNVLVQGSAADCTKQAMINYYATKPEHHQLLLTVHDEMLVLVPEDEIEEGMEILRAAMESVKFAVPMLSEGKTSTTNWSAMRAYDKGGVRV